MPNRPCRHNGANQRPPQPPVAAPEPEMRCWPHPTTVDSPPEEQSATRYNLSCALAYQNHLLTEIRDLLVVLAHNRNNARE